MSKINNIVVVGGGTAGWMTASLLITKFPDFNITVVESPSVSSIGVGESTLMSFRRFLKHLGLKDKEWMKECNATYKASIDFTNWDGLGTREKIAFGDTILPEGLKLSDWRYKFFKEYDYCEFTHTAGPILKANKIDKVIDGVPDWKFEEGITYHMDAGLFAEFLKNKYCIPRGVTYIQDDIKGSTKQSNNIIKLLGANKDYYADLFIDCTGFARALIEGEMGVGKRDLSHILINDRSIPIQIPYTNKEEQLEHSTNATTLNNGWVWKVPLWNRMGTGYVYSSKFVSEEGAEEEFKKYLLSNKLLTEEQLELMPFKHIKIAAYLSKKAWEGNVVAIGLSAGFIEPLASTGIKIIIKGIEGLCRVLEHTTEIRSIDKGVYNLHIESTAATNLGGVTSHYAFAYRNDTDYWKYITEEVEYLKESSFLTRSFYSRFAHNFQGAATSLNYSAASSLAHGKYDLYNKIGNKEREEESFNAIKGRADHVRNIAKNVPSAYEFLKEGIYNEAI
jgi:tryptophan halogenase